MKRTKQIAGFGMIDMMIASVLAILAMLPLGSALIQYRETQSLVGGRVSSKLSGARLLLQVVRTGRMASSCPGSTRNVLRCLVQFNPGVTEWAIFTFDEAAQTLRYERGQTGAMRTVSVFSGVDRFTVCSGREIIEGTCDDGDDVWSETAMVPTAPGAASSYFRLKLSIFLMHEKFGRMVSDGGKASFQSGFFARNITGAPAGYAWVPSEGL